MEGLDPKILIDVCKDKMPFGKYKGSVLADLPIHYLEWMHRQGMPPGKLGMQLSTVYEIKMNGLTDILYTIKKQFVK